MGASSEIRAEIERELIDCEAELLLRKLQLRARELTFGDLKELLDSPAGRRLHGHAVEALVRASDGARPAARPRRTNQEETAREILAVLHASRCPLGPRALCEATGRDSMQVQRALRQLRERGQVLMVDRPPRPTYWAQEGGDYTGASTASRHAAQVAAALRGGGRGLSLRELSEAAELSEERVRRALTYLINTRQVLRFGRSVSTRYALATGHRDEAARGEARLATGEAPQDSAPRRRS